MGLGRYLVLSNDIGENEEVTNIWMVMLVQGRAIGTLTWSSCNFSLLVLLAICLHYYSKSIIHCILYSHRPLAKWQSDVHCYTMHSVTLDYKRVYLHKYFNYKLSSPIYSSFNIPQRWLYQNNLELWQPKHQSISALQTINWAQVILATINLGVCATML